MQTIPYGMHVITPITRDQAIAEFEFNFADFDKFADEYGDSAFYDEGDVALWLYAS